MHAEAGGAAYLGVVLAGGPRLLTVEQARHVIGARRERVRRVAVFGNQPIEEMISIAEQLDLDVLQLHGVPGGARVGGFPQWRALAAAVDIIRRHTGREVWPVMRLSGAELPHGAQELAVAAGALVLDTHVVGQLGGTGVALDWRGLREAIDGLRAAVPSFTLVLAGGLKPENAAQAIGLLRPEVVDVSSGVEAAPGVKDPVRVREFLRAAHGAAEKK